MKSFSARMGLGQVRTDIQIEALDSETRMALWNVLYTTVGVVDGFSDDPDANRTIATAVWTWGAWPAARRARVAGSGVGVS